MKKTLILVVALLAASFKLTAGSNGNWHFGGSLGMSFGNYTNINISPQVGYSFNRFFSLGAGVNYNYYKNDDYDNSINYLGLNLNAKLYPVEYIFLFAQPEIQRRWGRVGNIKTKEETFGVLLLGGGVSLPVSYRGRIVMSVYYDVLQERSTPYGNKIGYSVGYSFSF